jgi:thioredoxin reductase (NADPH)
MAKPVLVVVDDEDDSRRALTDELGSRYGAHYEIISAGSPEVALARLGELRAAGAAVPLILADQWMPGMTGTEFLARAKQVIPTARRGTADLLGGPGGFGADPGGGGLGRDGVLPAKARLVSG